jgi:hypothetical protein
MHSQTWQSGLPSPHMVVATSLCSGKLAAIQGHSACKYQISPIGQWILRALKASFLGGNATCINQVVIIRVKITVASTTNDFRDNQSYASWDGRARLGDREVRVDNRKRYKCTMQTASRFTRSSEL